jgi:hypothetical protein
MLIKTQPTTIAEFVTISGEVFLIFDALLNSILKYNGVNIMFKIIKGAISTDPVFTKTEIGIRLIRNTNKINFTYLDIYFSY